MKIDNKGWGLNTLLICTGVIFIALITVTFFSIRLNGLLGKENKATNKTEKVVENQVEINYYINKKNTITSAAENFLEDYDITLTKSPIKIDISELIKNEYLNEITDYKTNKKCLGYALAYKNDVDYKIIKAFLKCDTYTSEGYGGN